MAFGRQQKAGVRHLRRRREHRVRAVADEAPRVKTLAVEPTMLAKLGSENEPAPGDACPANQLTSDNRKTSAYGGRFRMSVGEEENRLSVAKGMLCDTRLKVLGFIPY